jgi:hypothetical protein
VDRAILSLVFAVALVGALSAGTLVVGYRATIETHARESDPLVAVDESRFELDRLRLGASERAVRKHGALNFERRAKKDGVRSWRANIRDNPRYRSARVITHDGRVVGVRVRYREPNLLAHDLWRELLPAPYRTTDEDRHWETERLKLKASRDATVFYVVRKDHRSKLAW